MSLLKMRKKCQYSELFWSVFSLIWTKYGEISPYLSVFSPNAGKYGPEYEYGHFPRSVTMPLASIFF